MTIRRKALKAWADYDKVEVLLKHSDSIMGRVMGVSTDDNLLRLFVEGGESSEVWLADIEDIRFLDEVDPLAGMENIEVPAVGVAKKLNFKAGLHDNKWYVYDMNQCVGLGAYKCVAVIDNEVLPDKRESFARQFAAAPEILAMLEEARPHLLNGSDLSNRIKAVIKKARGK